MGLNLPPLFLFGTWTSTLFFLETRKPNKLEVRDHHNSCEILDGRTASQILEENQYLKDLDRLF